MSKHQNTRDWFSNMLVSAARGLLLMLVWNAVLVPWLHAPHLSFWLAWAMIIVLRGIFAKQEG